MSAAPDYGNFAFHLASPRPLRGRAILRGDAAADLPSGCGVGPGPAQLRRRRTRLRLHAVPFATEDKAGSNPLRTRYPASDSLPSVSDLGRLHQIHTETLRFGVVRPRSPLLKVIPCSTSSNPYLFDDSFRTALVFFFDSPCTGRDPPVLRYTILYPVI